MSAAVDLISQRTFEIVANASWGAFLLLSLVWGLLRLFRSASSAFRAMVWMSALLATLILPACLLVLPESWMLKSAVSESHGQISLRSSDHDRSHVTPVLSNTPAIAEVADRESILPAHRLARLAPVVSRIMITVWLAGFLFVLGRAILGHLLLQARRGTPGGTTDSDWDAAAHEVAAELNLTTPVALREDASTTTPAVWGFRRPTVFLPPLSVWSRERKRVILLHEFAHIKRGDPQSLWLKQLVAAFYWFHPMVRLALSESGMASEQACDDLVLRAGVPPCDYASHLLELSESLPVGADSAAWVGLLGTQSLERRVVAILDTSASRRLPSRSARLLAGLTILTLLLTGAVTRPLAPTSITPATPTPSVVPSPVVASPAPAPTIANVSPEAEPPVVARPEPSARPTEALTVAAASTPLVTPPNASPEIRDLTPAVVSSQPPVRPSSSPATGEVQAIDRDLAVTEPTAAIAVPTVADPLPTVSTPVMVTLPAGTPLWLIHTKALNSKTAQPGTTVTFLLVHDLMVDDVVVVKAGATAVGTVSRVKKASPPGRSGALDVRLDYLQVGEARVALRSAATETATEIHYSTPFALKWPFGLLRNGNEVTIASGTGLTAYVSSPTTLPAVK